MQLECALQVTARRGSLFCLGLPMPLFQPQLDLPSPKSDPRLPPALCVPCAAGLDAAAAGALDGSDSLEGSVMAHFAADGAVSEVRRVPPLGRGCRQPARACHRWTVEKCGLTRREVPPRSQTAPITVNVLL
jgi:hypothetical protein